MSLCLCFNCSHWFLHTRISQGRKSVSVAAHTLLFGGSKCSSDSRADQLRVLNLSRIGILLIWEIINWFKIGHWLPPHAISLVSWELTVANYLYSHVCEQHPQEQMFQFLRIFFFRIWGYYFEFWFLWLKYTDQILAWLLCQNSFLGHLILIASCI